MITKDKTKMKLVRDFYDASIEKKYSEKKYEKLKEEIKILMAGDNVLVAGDYTVTKSERTRSDFNKEKLAEDEGQEFVDAYTFPSTYNVFTPTKK
jgi:hypothetical protein